MNNHRNNVNVQNALQVHQHFKLPGLNFNQHAKFILIEQLDNIRIDEDLTTFRLKKREDFWILTLFSMGKMGVGKKDPPTSFSPATSTNVGLRLQNFLTFSFNPFSRLV